MSAPRAVLTAFIAALALSTPALADPTLNLKITDNVGAGYDVDVNGAAGSGFVNFNGAIGAWNVNVSTGLGTPASPSTGELDLNSIDATNQIGSHHLTIILTESGLSGGSGAALIAALNSIGGTSPDISWSACVDSSCSGGGSHTAPPLGFSSNDAWVASISNLGNFTMTITIDIFHTNSATTSFDSNLILQLPLQQVPEPQSLLLFGLALALLGFVRSRRKP